MGPMKLSAGILVTLSLLTGVCHAAASPSTPRQTVQAYLDAIAAGDARTICHLMSAKARREVKHELASRSCPQALKDIPRALGRVTIAKVQVNGPDATVWVNDARYSDSGNDNVTLRRVHDHWFMTGI